MPPPLLKPRVSKNPIVYIPEKVPIAKEKPPSGESLRIRKLF